MRLKEIVSITTEPVEHAKQRRDAVGCTNFNYKDYPFIYRTRKLILWRREIEMPFIFDKRTRVFPKEIPANQEKKADD